MEGSVADVERTWQRLRHRKVVQWALAYAAGSWVLLQVLGYAADAFGWPALVKQLAMLGLALGLPVALTVAWYHGDRPQQKITGQELAIVTGLLLAGGVLLWWFADRRAEAPSIAATTTSAAQAITDARPSIAVLPFENRSDVDKDAFFVDGIHDDILTQLSRVSGLKVISRTSVERFRETNLSIQQIAAQLGVTSILEGGVQRAGDRVRVNVQLIDAKTDAHLWAENYDRELTATDIFAIQSEVAGAIAGALETALTPGEQARMKAVPTRNLEAWEAYQVGRQHMAKRTSQALAEAEQAFTSAISLDRTFALAHVGLANTYALQVWYSGASIPANLARAEVEVETALALDPNLGEAWASSGLIEVTRSQDRRAAQLLRRAIELNPNDAAAQQWLSLSLEKLDLIDDALEHAIRAVQLDPLYANAVEAMALALEDLGRFREAEDSYRKSLAIDPTRPSAYALMGWLHASVLNRFADAVRLMERACELNPEGPRLQMSLAEFYLELDDIPRATQITTESLERWPSTFELDSRAGFVFSSLLNSEAARRAAQRALALNAKDEIALALLRNGDLGKGDYRAARARYAAAFPELFDRRGLRVDGTNYTAAVDLALVLRQTGESDRAKVLLDRSESVLRGRPRLGNRGYLWTDIQIHALRGQKREALARLRSAERAGLRFGWRYARNVDPNLASIRNAPEFKAVFADIERDMARQRAELAARPKDAALDIRATGT